MTSHDIISSYPDVISKYLLCDSNIFNGEKQKTFQIWLLFCVSDPPPRRSFSEPHPSPPLSPVRAYSTTGCSAGTLLTSEGDGADGVKRCGIVRMEENGGKKTRNLGQMPRRITRCKPTTIHFYFYILFLFPYGSSAWPHTRRETDI